MIQINYPCTIIYGPTAVGKTDIALALAERVGGTIINADVGQFYAPLSIGTAKPIVPHPHISHYMFDYCDTPRDITVVEYRAKVLDILAHNPPYPIIVGGSGFYISSLFFPPSHLDDTLEHKVSMVHDNSWSTLHSLDPERAAKIHPHDMYRIARALKLFAQTGNKPSMYHPQYNPIAPTMVLIALDRERDDLYARINERVGKMMHAGWIEEVQDVMHRAGWRDFLLRKKLLGYPEIINYLENDALSMQHLHKLIAQKNTQLCQTATFFWAYACW